MKKSELQQKFDLAKRSKAKFIGVLINMPGFKENELIINGNKNFSKKLAYYMDTYNDDLEHRFSKEIYIVDCAFGDDMTFIASQLGLQSIW